MYFEAEVEANGLDETYKSVHEKRLLNVAAAATTAAGF